MKKLFSILLCAIVLFITDSCLAEFYDLPNMNRQELNELRSKIEAELEENHSVSSSQRSIVENSYKKSVENYYGTDNVEWPWIDYTYTRDWDYYTIKTYAKITKQDGGKARYDLEGAVLYDGATYQTIFMKIGNEIITDNREEVIADPRVRTMLGYDTVNDVSEAEQVIETTQTPQQSKDDQEQQTDSDIKPENNEQTTTFEISYKNGDRGNDVKFIQKILIKLGYLTGTADGAFGRMTEDAVKRFQQQANLSVTGIVDKETYAELNRTNTPVAPTPTPAPLSFTAVSLYNKYKSNEVSANAELKGESISVSGKIYSIEEDSGWFSNEYIVKLYADTYGFSHIYCYFSEDHANELAKLVKEHNVVIVGTCDGTALFGDVILRDCEIVG